ncbi:MAG TPA: insulinase family protein [Longimicrobiales bacterium]|nr:insulinase family protein [Longimicrobiales bacterium]
MHNRMLFTLNALLLAGSTAAFGQAQTKSLKTPPPALPMAPVAFPAFVERSLANGAQVLVVENHEQPVVSVNIYMRGAGSTSDPEGKPGVAELTAALLKAGTKTRSSLQIAQTFDGMGAQTFASAGPDWASFTVTALKNDLDVALATAADMLVNASFPADEFETQRKRTLTNLQVQLSQPAQLASRVFQTRVYGAHPYGRVTTTTSLRALSRDDVVNFFNSYYKPGNALVVIAGDVNPNEIVGAFEKHFAAWKGSSPPRPKFAAAPALAGREIVLVNKPGAVQAAFRIGHTIAPAPHADWPALIVAQQILGGGSKGWLFDILREKKGYTYGAYAQSAQRLDPGHFQMWGDVRNEVADSALQLFLDLHAKVKNQPVSAAELELAKAQLTGSFPLTIETPAQIAGQVASSRLLGQAKDHVQTWRQKLAAVTAADVQRVARAHYHPENAVIVISGDANVLKPKLEKFGKLTVVDEEGRAVTAADMAPKTSVSGPLDASTIKPMTLVYSVSFQGNPVAENNMVVTRAMLGGKDVVKVNSATSGMMTATNELVFEAKSFTPVSMNMEMQMGPQTMSQKLVYANGKITGTSKLPQGDKTINADAPAGTLMSGMDQFALMLNDFAATKEVSLPVFNAQTGTISSFTAKVVGESKVTVPAGSFDVYELDVSGAEGSMKVFVSKAAPRVIVKQEFATQPVVMELKSLK